MGIYIFLAVVIVIGISILVGVNCYSCGLSDGEEKGYARRLGFKPDEQPRKIMCKICGCEFIPQKQDIYLSRQAGESGIARTFSTHEPTLYESMDCPICGCQTLLGIRQQRNECQDELAAHLTRIGNNNQNKEIEIIDLAKD